MEKTIAISIVDASKSYDGQGALAVHNVSLEVHEGEFVAIVGESGSGKTTLLKLINRLVEPSGGEIIVSGNNVGADDPIRLRRSIGYVFQEVGLFPHMTVAENVAVTPRLLGWDSAKIAARVAELLELVRLPQETAARFPATLSGGQRQRVGVARALAAGPKIMLMDEPFGAVDAITREGLAGDYRTLHERLQLTTILITHDVVEAVLLADRIAVMHGGTILEVGTPQNLLSHPVHDYVRELMAMPRQQADRVGVLLSGAPR
jgi:osmoprotectant transport system ATP-binding protein